MTEVKIIENHCNAPLSCLLEIDGAYFGYDNDPAYPETTYKDVDKAHVFRNPKNALDVTTFMTGKSFKIIRYHAH